MRRPDPLAGVNLLDLAPRRRAVWREVEGHAVIERPRPPLRGVRGLLDRLAFHLAPRRIRLDELGTFAWQRFDGSVSVREVAEALRVAFGERVEPAEERLGSLVRMMRREGLLSYPYPDD